MMTSTALNPARLWQRHPREIVALGGLAAAALVAVAGSAWSSPALDQIRHPGPSAAPPAPPPLLVRDIGAEQAFQENQQIPVAGGPNPAASPFSTANLSATAKARALDCLASAVYYEAGSESIDGERAVAQVVLNRVRHPAFPASVCGVVYQGSTRATGCQFTFTCDGSLERRPDADGWARATRIAEAALDGAVFGPVGWATHYHADYVVPYWAANMAKNAAIGAHLFYRWAGQWGRPSAFTESYARQEPDSKALRYAALAAYESRPARTVEQQVASIPGAQVEKAPNGRVAVRFTAARLEAAKKAVQEAPHEDYVKQFAASDNLSWALSGESSGTQAPLGRHESKQAATATVAAAN